MTAISVPDMPSAHARASSYRFGVGQLYFKPEGSDEWQALGECSGFTIYIDPVSRTLRLRMKRKGRPGWKRADWRSLR